MVVVEGGNVLRHVKWRENVQGELAGEGYVQEECPDRCLAASLYCL